jgi:hypothetical protein
MLRFVATACLAFAVAVAATGCSAPVDDNAQSSGASAFTVASGDRFVVSATSDKIVLKKSVDGAVFPFDDASLLGKAILIHPVAKRAADGVYARALDVHDEGDRWVIDAAPLTLEEMESATEDEIVRIYLDPHRNTTTGGAQLAPASLHPTSLDGFAFNGFDVSSGYSFQTPTFVRAGVSFSHKVEAFSLDPQAVVTWSRAEGLELGFKGAFEWKSSLTLAGTVSGEIFRSKTITSPKMIVFVPIGFVPVPIALEASGFMTCSATLKGPLEVTLKLAASANVAGSIKVKPSGSDRTEWIKQGRWAPELGGSASATPTAQGLLAGSIGCSVPRIELHAYVAGVAGPYLALSPNFSVDDAGGHFEGRIAAGVGASMLGIGTGVEVNLYTWKP